MYFQIYFLLPLLVVPWLDNKALKESVTLVAFTVTIPVSCKMLVVMPADLRIKSGSKWRSKQNGSCPHTLCQVVSVT